MNIPNRQVVCNVLMELAEQNKKVVVLCSDSRGSGSMTDFANTYPDQFVEVGIAEQSLVSIAAGIAMGLYDSEKIYDHIQRREYLPALSKEERNERYSGWKNAVNQALNHP